MRELSEAVRGRRRVVALLLIASTVPLRVGAQGTISLRFEEIRLQGGGRLELDTKRSTAEPCPNESVMERVGSLSLSIDPRQIVYSNDRFHYPFCLRSTDGRSWVFEVVGVPEGDFAYEKREVDFRVEVDGQSSEGSIRLPIYSLNPPVFVAWQRAAEQNSDDPIVARLGREDAHPLELKNLTQFIVAVRLQHGRQVEGPADWHLSLKFGGDNEPKEIAIDPGKDSGTMLQLVARPSLVAAVQQLVDRDSRAAYLPLEYRAGVGPWIRHDLEVKLRCVPSLPELLVALVLGVSLGSTGTFLWSRRRPSWKAWPRQTSASLILALVLWLLAMVLAWGKNELKLFGYPVEPNDTISVLVTSMLIGLGGRRSWEWLREKLPFDDDSDPDRAG